MPEYHLDCSLAAETRKALDSFTFGYISAAMWTLTDDDGGSLDYLGLHDIAQSAINAAVTDCRQFQADNAEWLAEYDDEQAGVDFWLTRNRHGAGYWDGDYTQPAAAKLTAAAHAFGEVDWYVADDGMVYQG